MSGWDNNPGKSGSGANEPDMKWGTTGDTDGAAGNGFEPDNSFTGEATTFQDDRYNENNGNDASYGNGGGPSGAFTCRNCGAEGHKAAECSEPRKMTGECYNCGEVGHNKADCPNPRVPRPFTGECRICHETGHPAAECPQKPPVVCKNCQKEGHKTSDCTGKRVLYHGVPDMEPDAAWSLLVDADRARELDDIKDAFEAYAKATKGEYDFAEIESTFRDEKFNIYLVALEREIPDTSTVVDLAGNIDRKFVVCFTFDPKPKRARFADQYPKNADENLERLKNAGFIKDRMVPKCLRCGELGHIVKHCSQEATEVERKDITCTICKESGHRARDCTKERINPFACRNCKQVGHTKADCPNPPSDDNITCNKCNQVGHRARQCPNSQNEGDTRTCHKCGEEGHIAKDCEKIVCRNCDGLGHYSRDCPKPKDWSRVQCSNCQEYGHTYKRCKKPQADTGDLGAGGDADAGAPIVATGGWE